MGKQVVGIIVALTTLLLDQMSKAMILANSAALEGGISVFQGFNLVFWRNYGVSFGLFSWLPWWAPTLLAIGIIAFLAGALWLSKNVEETIAYGMIIGGAFGNVVDRVRFGGVIDFLDFYIGGTHWPSFNLADAFIVCGVALLIFAGGRQLSA